MSDSSMKEKRTRSVVAFPASPVRGAHPRHSVRLADANASTTSHGGRVDAVGHGNMVKRLSEIGDFVRKLRIQARFGELSREPLRLLRFELLDGRAECDWIARPADQWDSGLMPRTSERHVSEQALHDAIAVRDLLFRALPDLRSALVRAYRPSPEGNPELVITGGVSRDQYPPVTVRSLTMRAKLFGLQFSLDDGVLENLQPEDFSGLPPAECGRK